MRFAKQVGRLAAWLEVAALPAVTGVAVGISSGLSMGGLTGWLVLAGLSLAGLATGAVLAERDRRQSRR